MKIQKLHIQNYKSLVDLEIIEPNPFTVFAGSNGAGKSNIFEAIEFFTLLNRMSADSVISLNGGTSNILNRKSMPTTFTRFEVTLGFGFPHSMQLQFSLDNGRHELKGTSTSVVGERFIDTINTSIEDKEIKKIWNDGLNHRDYVQFFKKSSRVFINNSKIQNFQNDDSILNFNCSNLEKVLKRLLLEDNKRIEITDWLDLLIPGFENIEIANEPLSGTDSLVIYEKGTNKPFTKNLLSDGTWNILALLTAVYQSDEAQFLCIEEPENGLNPKVQKELVNLFRQKCEEGHYIWLNTHSQTIIKQLEPKEIILVDKVDGATQIKQFPDFNLHGLPMDEAWLTNSLGGGLPW